MKAVLCWCLVVVLAPFVWSVPLVNRSEFDGHQIKQVSGDYEAGNRFTTGDAFFIVSALGFIDLNNDTPGVGPDGDGLIDPHRITLWRVSDQSKIAEMTVPAGTESQLVDGFRYVYLSTPITLMPNTQYMVSAKNGSADAYVNATMVPEQVTPNADILGDTTDWTYCYITPSNQYPTTNHNQRTFYGLASLLVVQSPDVSGDMYVDPDDLNTLIEDWLAQCLTDDCAKSDLNMNGQVEFGDIAIFANAWLQSTIPGLVNWLKLDQSTGAVAYDTLNLNDGTLYHTESDDWIESGDGYVLGLDGQSEADSLGEYLYLPRLIQDDFTISFWLRTNQKANEGSRWAEGRGLVDAEATGVQDDFSIVLLGNKVAFGVGDADIGDIIIQSTTSVNDGQWHQVTATRDSTTGDMKLYVDGSLENSAVGSTGTKDAQSRVLIGSMNVHNDKFLRGNFDDIRFYDRELNASEVAALTTKRFPAMSYKKGVGWGGTDLIEALGAAWMYNWNISRPAGLDGDIEYVPMRWGRWWPNLNAIGNVGAVDYLLGYNEPDSSGQSDTTVSQAVAQWPTIQAAADTYNLRLSSPATTHYNDQWIQDFMAAVDTPDSGLRVDFMAVHWYYPPNADNFMNNMVWVHNQWNRDVWVTEFNVADWDGTNSYTQDQSYTFLAEVLYRMEQTSWIKRYAIFPWDGSNEASKASPIFESGTSDLTPLGKLYASWDGDIDGPNQETWYFLNNESSHNRIRTNGTEIEMTTIFSMGSWVQWKLVDAGDGWYYLDNKGFSQRLGYDDTIGQLVPFSTTEMGDHLKWHPVHSEYGWYFMDHKSTNKRLHYRSDWSTATLESREYTNENMKWRFIPIRVINARDEEF